MLFIVRPVLNKRFGLSTKGAQLSSGLLAFAFITLLLSAWITEIDAEKCAKDHGEEGLRGICAEDKKEKRRLIEGADALFDILEDRAEEF